MRISRSWLFFSQDEVIAGYDDPYSGTSPAAVGGAAHNQDLPAVSIVAENLPMKTSKHFLTRNTFAMDISRNLLVS